jgi:hypothetical protein
MERRSFEAEVLPAFTNYLNALIFQHRLVSPYSPSTALMLIAIYPQQMVIRQ